MTGKMGKQLDLPLVVVEAPGSGAPMLSDRCPKKETGVTYLDRERAKKQAAENLRRYTAIVDLARHLS